MAGPRENRNRVTEKDETEKFRGSPDGEDFEKVLYKKLVNDGLWFVGVTRVFVEAAKHQVRSDTMESSLDEYALLSVCDYGSGWVAKNGNKIDEYVARSSLISLNRGSFDVIVGMDWLSKRKFVIVCYEKVVRIPLEGDEILRVHSERTQGVVKTLLNTKTRVSYDLVIFREDHQCRLLRRGAWSSFEVSVRITKEGEVVTYLRFIANFSKIVKPHTSLTERNQKYEWGAEREDAF
ncbi:hypothetical protein Tco_0260829 [Tanacetum coccineum]